MKPRVEVVGPVDEDEGVIEGLVEDNKGFSGVVESGLYEIVSVAVGMATLCSVDTVDSTVSVEGEEVAFGS